MSIPIEKAIEELSNEIAEKVKKVKVLTDLSLCFEGIKVFKDSKTFATKYYSKDVNADVDSVDIAHGCTCCSGAPLNIWPFITIEGVRLYSDPPMFEVGHGNSLGFGEHPYSDWKAKLESNGINKAVISKISEYLKRHPPVDYDTLDED